MSETSTTETPEPAWYCVHTKPKCEHLVAAALRQLDGVEPWCPRLRFQRSTPRGKVWFVEALFPSYLFAKFVVAESYRAVRHAHNVIRVVEFGGVPAPVPEEAVRQLQEEMGGQDLREVHYGVQVGDTVEVAEGPMHGLKGIVESFMSGEQRARVLLEFLGRQSLIEVSTAKLLSDRRAREIMAQGGKEKKD
jgi:transcription antitermination factor NusG